MDLGQKFEINSQNIYILIKKYRKNPIVIKNIS
jgi:hypothetical protein